MLRDASWPLRPAAADAVTGFWEWLARPGTCWPAAARVDMVRQARLARRDPLDRRREEALTPYAVEEHHAATDHLPAVANDAVHRIATDPGRLSGRWHRECLDGGLTEAALVELIGVTAGSVTVDTLHRGLGLEAPDLPEPGTGDPDGPISSNASVHSARVPTVAPDVATGVVADVYEAAWEDMVPNVLRSLTLVPDTMVTVFELLGSLYARGIGPTPDDWRLSRPQVELLASTVSAHNDCFY